MLTVPATVPQHQRKTYLNHYATITKNTEHLFLFAADQKMEHLNDDFYGPGIAQEVNDPDHVFFIAEKGHCGAFATHLGLISRYGPLYQTINYIAKLNGKTSITTGDPLSTQLWSVEDALSVAKTANLNLCGVGYTLYPGSEHEQTMLAQAAEIVKTAHAHGLIAILWIYPRSQSITHERNPHLIAGAAGLGASLGADFVKIREPETCATDLQEAVHAAGLTKVIVSGGKTITPEQCLEHVYQQLHDGKVCGAAIGRNIFQHDKATALRLSHALSLLIYENASLEQALSFFKTTTMCPL